MTPEQSTAEVRSGLEDRFARVRRATLDLAAPLSAEDCLVQTMPDVSPTKWHLAHTTWFFETFVLAASSQDYRPFDDAFGYLFNSYYNTVGSMHPRPQRGLLSRPSLETIIAYRRHVDERVGEFLGSSGPDDALLAIIELGIQHEQQHQELIVTDIKHVLSCNPTAPVYRARELRSAHRAAEPAGWIETQGGDATIGHDGNGFAFDNEGPRHRVALLPFAIADRPVTAGEFQDFIDDGGYERPELWLSDGWAAVGERGWTAPLYWQDDGSHFTLGGRVDRDPSEAVTHVSLYEADAYARWAGARLATEAEWEIAARAMPPDGNFVESGAFHPRAADPKGPSDFFGNTWEWTQSAYAPYPRYAPPEGALGEYNGKFMSSQVVLRGGSCATPESHIRATYRNFFPPDARWQFSGIRLAKDL